MKIDVTDGSVSFSSGAIAPDLDRAAFLKTPIASTAEQMLANANVVNFDISPEPGLTGTVTFRDDRLRRVCLLMRIPTDDSGEWTEELELGRKRKHDEWLRSQLGMPPYEYPWGTVASEYDPRGCVSDIIVSYSE